MEKYSLKDVREVYSLVSASPAIYKIGTYVTFLSRGNFLRKKAVNNLNLELENKILDLACGMGQNFDYLMNKIGGNGKIFGVEFQQLRFKMMDIKDEKNDIQSLPIEKEPCSKCGNEEAYSWQRQTRSGDEPATRFYRCVKCEHTWREYS